MTSLESPRDERPAVKANGTVSPSESPITLYGGRLARVGQAPEPGNEGDAHISDNIRIDELTFVLPNQFSTTHPVPVVAVS